MSAAELLALAQRGDIAAACKMMDADCAAADPDGWYVRGLWHVEGRILPRNLSDARTAFAAAESLGHRGGARILAGFIARGIGGSRDWGVALDLLAAWRDRDPLAARQHALIAAMSLDRDGNPLSEFVTERLCARPRIEHCRQFVSLAEAEFLVDLARPRLARARVYDAVHARFVVDPLRTSSAAGFPLVHEYPFVTALNRRIAALSGTSAEQGEPLQVLRYAPGEEYRAHLDAIPGLANPRVLTVLIYLDDGYAGGETEFGPAKLRFRGHRGSALMFGTVDDNGRPDPAAEHAGRPVTSGTKTIASRWIRAEVPDQLGDFGNHEVTAQRSAR